MNGKKLHPGRALLLIDLVTDDLRSDSTLSLRGEVRDAGTAAPSLGVTVDPGILGR